MGLGGAAADAVRNWRFKPATLNGRPVTVYYVLTVHFTLQ
jgi:outer membrane biosynthesis protein TonB